MTPPLATTKSSQKKKQTVNSFGMFKIDSPEESIDSLDFFKPKSIAKAAAEQVKPQGDWAKDWLGLSAEPTSAGSIDMQPGVGYSPAQMAEAQKAQEQGQEAKQVAEAPMNYVREILHAGESKKEEKESGEKISMLIQELQRLATSVQAIEKAMILQAIDPSTAQKTGKYYENFFEWMLLVVQDARRKVEDSGAWLNAMNGKKKPGIHKQMKTNMQIGMSGERNQSNSAG